MYKMITLALFIAAEKEKPQWLGRKRFYKLWSTIIKPVKTAHKELNDVRKVQER